MVRPPSAKRSGKSKDQGFTLLEVIIAFIIMALIMGATFNTFSIGLRQAALTDHYAGALVRAESHMALLGSAEPLDVGVKTGRFDGFYAWRTQITPVVMDDAEAPEDASHQLVAVVLTVFWGDGRDTRQVTLRSLRLKAPEKS